MIHFILLVALFLSFLKAVLIKTGNDDRKTSYNRHIKSSSRLTFHAVANYLNPQYITKLEINYYAPKKITCPVLPSTSTLLYEIFCPIY